ncbi:hypothetical protein NMY22_g1953 [Coprinellus aureogranulatus]|nr:hypothetical protein NMY22_g1953 [Coprinellus aureogranulatus]
MVHSCMLSSPSSCSALTSSAETPPHRPPPPPPLRSSTGISSRLLGLVPHLGRQCTWRLLPSLHILFLLWIRCRLRARWSVLANAPPVPAPPAATAAPPVPAPQLPVDTPSQASSSGIQPSDAVPCSASGSLEALEAAANAVQGPSGQTYAPHALQTQSVQGGPGNTDQERTEKKVWVKHIFTCNLVHLQKFAGELVEKLQSEVELVRNVGDATSPFFECSYNIPSTPDVVGDGGDEPQGESGESSGVVRQTDGGSEVGLGGAVPAILLKTATFLAKRVSGYAEVPMESVKVEKIRVLGWMVAGSRKNQGILKAKEHPVGVMCLGTDVVITLSLVPKKDKAEATQLTTKPIGVGEGVDNAVALSATPTVAPKKKGRPPGKGKGVPPFEPTVEGLPIPQPTTSAPNKGGAQDSVRIQSADAAQDGLLSATNPHDNSALLSAPPPKRRGRPPGSRSKPKTDAKGKGKETALETEEADPQMDYDIGGLIQMADIQDAVMDVDGDEEDGSGRTNPPTSGSSFMRGNVMQGASSSQPPPVGSSMNKLAESTVQVTMVHGDVLVVSGEDFTYSLKRSGIGFLVYALPA